MHAYIRTHLYMYLYIYVDMCVCACARFVSVCITHGQALIHHTRIFSGLVADATSFAR